MKMGCVRHVLIGCVPLSVSAACLLGGDLSAGEAPEAGACLESKIRFDITSLEAVVLRPEAILEDVDAFWQEDGAYKLMSVWHEMNNQPKNIDDWIRRVSAYAEVPVGERAANPLLILGQKYKESESALNEKAMAHICSFLPGEVEPVETTVYFATEQMTSGIAVHDEIVMHIRNQQMLNLIVHETYHIGFEAARGEAPPIDRAVDPIGWISSGLQFEGMATYVGFRALDLFPAPKFEDYQMLTDADDRSRLHRRLNSLFARAKSYTPEKLQKTAWRIGVQERAHYVVGGFMAQTIDEKLGRQTLVETISEGPRSFIQKYNSVAAEDMKIVAGEGL